MEVQISRSDTSVFEFDYAVPGIALESVEYEGKAFTRIEIPEVGFTGDIGTPQLPAFRRFVEIPHGAAVSVDAHVLEWQSVRLSDFGFSEVVVPVQASVPKCDCPEARNWVFTMKEDSYTGTVEHGLVRTERPVLIRDHQMVRLVFSPVRYDTDAGILKVASRVAVRVNFDGGSLTATAQEKERLSSRAFDQFLKATALNVNFSGDPSGRDAGWAYPTDAPVDFLIITPPAFVSDLEPFVDWKASCGYRVNLVTTDIAGTTTSEIKSFISGQYGGANPPVYILMIGDSPSPLPTYTTSAAGGGTDLPYVQMDADLYPDMMISRWPIDDSTELINMRDKILHYEQPTAANSAWMNRALFMAGDDYMGRVTTHEDVIAELMDPPPNSAETDLWYGDTEDPTTQDLIDDLNTGRAWAVYSAHSGPSGWSGDPPLDSGDMANFGNTDMYPISHGHSCSSNEWNNYDDVFGEAAVIQPSKGFVSYWGGSNSTYWDGDDWLERGFFDSLVEADMAANAGDWDGHFSAVAACYAGLSEVSAMGGGSAGETYYWEIYNLNGDPTLDPFTRLPYAINVGAPQAIAPSATDSFTVDVDYAGGGVFAGALVAASQDGVLLGAGYTDATGTAVFHIDAPDPGSAMLVRVTGHNALPTDASVMVGAEADGIVTLDGTIYPCSSTVTIDVFDSNHDGAPPTVTLGTSVANFVLVPLVDVGDVTGHYQGSATLGTDLIVAHGDTLTVEYADQDTGSGNGALKTDTASIDCQAPIISNVMTTGIEWDGARVEFDTDEFAVSTVRYGLSCGALNQSVGGMGGTEHSLQIGDLTPLTTYYYAIDVVDPAGNAGTDDNGGSCYAFATLEEPIFFTEMFSSEDNDLSYTSLTFQPNGSGSYYGGCAEPIGALPVDPTGGTTLSLSDDDSETVSLSGGAMVGLYGNLHGSFSVVSNGYINFGADSTDYSETLEEHFSREQVAALYDDLNPSDGGTISWKQMADRVVVTYENVPEFSGGNSNTFQVELHFDGTVVISFLGIDATDGLAGLSEGVGLDPDFEESDLSAMESCGCIFVDGFENGNMDGWSVHSD